MRWTSVLAIFFITWFLVLFAVLPFGVRTQDDEQDRVLGTPGSAPAKPHLLKTAGITTIVTAVLVGAYYYVYAVLGFNTAWLARSLSW
jgi:predicted secreted protein